LYAFFVVVVVVVAGCALLANAQEIRSSSNVKFQFCFFSGAPRRLPKYPRTPVNQSQMNILAYCVLLVSCGSEFQVAKAEECVEGGSAVLYWKLYDKWKRKQIVDKKVSIRDKFNVQLQFEATPKASPFFFFVIDN